MPVVNLFQLTPFLITTLGIFELSVVYSPDSETFRMKTVGNSHEAMQEAGFTPHIPLKDLLSKFPRQAYITQEFSQYEGSGRGPNGTKITDEVYLFVNETSGRLSAVKNVSDASKITIIDEDGSDDRFLVGDCYKHFNEQPKDSKDKKCTKLFKGVIPYLTTQENQTVLDFDQSYITTEEVQSTDMFAVVALFGRHLNHQSC